jgi:Na+/H+ antiporter NhaD/arsenite permease-like protein
MLLAIIIFLLTYVGLLVFPKYRAYIALSSALLFILLGIMPLDEIFGSVDWNVILMIAGTMGIVSLFIESKMPAKLADKIIAKTPNVKWAIVALSLFASLISAFIDNVATVLILAPIAITIAKKLKISPVSSIIAIAIASNLQGAATLVGDTTSIMLGGAAGMDFLDFFVFQGKIGLFFVVQAGAVAATAYLIYFLRNEKQKLSSTLHTEVTNIFPSYLLIGVVVFLILASFIPNKPAIANGLICVSLFVIGLIYDYIRFKKPARLLLAIKEIDVFTLLLLAGLFIVIGSIENAGVIAAVSDILADLSGGNLFVIYTIVVFFSVIFSAFVDNIPYVATMLPVVAALALSLGVEPYILYFGLLIGATLGGNLTPIGASANITGIGILRKEGYEVKLWDYMKIGLPYSLSAVLVGYLLIWFIWS